MSLEIQPDKASQILLDNLGLPAFLFNQKLDVISGNKRFSSLFRLSKNQSANRKLQSFFKSGDAELKSLNHFVETDDENQTELSVSAKVMGEEAYHSGKNVTLLLQRTGLSGNVFLGMVTGLGKSIEANKPDVSDDHLFKLLLNELPDAIYFKDLMGRFFLTNRLHINKLGLKSVDEFTGKTDFDLFSEEHARQAFDDEQHVINTGETISKEEKETHFDGSETWASTSKMPLRNESGRIVGTFGISKDITQIKNAEIQLRKAEKILQETNAAKDKFFSILAHDLKNPFNSLIGMSELLVDDFDKLTKDEQLDMIIRIHRTSESAYALLENLLDWSRVQSGSMSMHPEKIELEPLVDEILDLNHLHAYNKGITIKKEIAAGVEICADENMLRTVLRNLVSNAIKFTPRHGIVIVMAKFKEDNIQIIVEDNGIGMDKSTQQKLFKISEKVKTFGTADESGTGLGLIIVREFIEKNRGTITVESEEGKGSRFIVTIPDCR